MILAVARHVLESTLFAAVLLLVVACLRYRSASTRYTLLLCAALKFALPVQWLLAIGALLRAVVPAPEMQVTVPLGVHRLLSPSAVSAPVSETGALLNFIFFAVWFAVAALFLFAWQRRLFAAIDVSGTVSGAGKVALERMKVRMGITREVRLKTSENLEPRLCGLLRPTVVLPESLSQRLMPEELDAVILHELAHVRRWDNLTRAIVHVLTCIFWFFPLLSWLERRIDVECELACDELVLFCGARPQEYLDGILKVCQFYVLESIAGSSNIGGSNLKQRMEFIMSSRMGKTNTLSAGVLIGALVSGLAAAAIITGFFTATSNRVRVLAASDASKASVSCLFGGKYPEGTVIQVGKGPEQMCVKWHDGQPWWVQISDQARTRSQKIVSLPEPAPFVCTPTAPDGNYCTCRDHGRTSLNGRAMGPDHQALTCGAHGQWMQAYKKR